MTTGHEDLDSIDPIPRHLPPGRRVERPRVPLVSTLAGPEDHPSRLHAPFPGVDAGGRRSAPPSSLVPADRVRPFRASSFHGVAVGADLPPRWLVPQGAAPQFRRDPGGAMADTGGGWCPHGRRPLGQDRGANGVVYYETRQDGYFARANDLSVERAGALPT
jgi:hypothetical protein